MIYNILVTHEQYYTIAFVMFQFGWMYTAKTLFPFPDEVENDSNSYN
jgi:hypothetical protein